MEASYSVQFYVDKSKGHSLFRIITQEHCYSELELIPTHTSTRPMLSLLF